MLELSDRDFKYLFEMSKNFMEKVENMHKQVGKFIREVRTIRKLNRNCRNKQQPK